MKDLGKQLPDGIVPHPKDGGIAGEETLKAYDRGIQAGARAEDASILDDIAQRTRGFSFKNPPIPLDRDRSNFRSGYIDGLKRFLVDHKISSPKSLLRLIVATPEMLADDTVLPEYLKGLRLKAPGVQRDYYGHETKKSKNLLYTSKSFELEMVETRDDRTKTWKLGFVARIARDYDTNLGLAEIPQDNTGYDIFMGGFAAKPRQLPRDYKLGSKYTSRTLSGSDEFSDDILYIAGLKVWLGSKGVAESLAWAIRNPDALEGFKDGLDGTPLPKPTLEDILRRLKPEETSKQRTIKSLEKGFERKFIDRKDELFPDTPDPRQEARNQRAYGYNLGLSVRTSSLKSPQE